MQVKEDTSIELGGNSRGSAGRGRGQVEKVFIEPEYHGVRVIVQNPPQVSRSYTNECEYTDQPESKESKGR